MSKHVISTVAVIGALALAGCGGGGGSGAPAPSAAITSSNATQIAASVMSSAQNAGDLGSFAFSGSTTTLSTSSKSILAARVAEVQNAQVDALVRRTHAIALATIPPETTACTDGGTITVSGNVSMAGALSPNDTIVFDYASCVEGEATINGRFSMRVTSFSGDVASGTFSLGVSVQISSFQVTVGADTATVNGSVSLVIGATASGTVTTTVTSSSITVTDGSVTNTLSNYSSTSTVTSGAFTRDVSGTLSSTAFSGSVTFDTTTLLQGTGSGFAYVGQVVITGANGATIKVVVLDATFVRLEVDTNGDGTVDATLDVTWTDLG